MARIFVAARGQVGGEVQSVHTQDWLAPDALCSDACVSLYDLTTKAPRWPDLPGLGDRDGPRPDWMRDGDTVRAITDAERAARDAAQQAAETARQQEQLVHQTAQAVALVSAAERLRRDSAIPAELAAALRTGLQLEAELLDRALVKSADLEALAAALDLDVPDYRTAFLVLLDILAGKARNPLRGA